MAAAVPDAPAAATLRTLTVRIASPMQAAMLDLILAGTGALDLDIAAIETGERGAVPMIRATLRPVIADQDDIAKRWTKASTPAVPGRICPTGDDDEAIDRLADLLEPMTVAQRIAAQKAVDMITGTVGGAPASLAADLNPPPTTPQGIVAALACNPRLSDVCRCLLSPLIEANYEIDAAHAEALLTRLANDFADYAPRQLAAAVTILRRGKHRDMPDRREVLAALGEASRPGAKSSLAA